MNPASTTPPPQGPHPAVRISAGCPCAITALALPIIGILGLCGVIPISMGPSIFMIAAGVMFALPCACCSSLGKMKQSERDDAADAQTSPRVMRRTVIPVDQIPSPGSTRLTATQRRRNPGTVEGVTPGQFLGAFGETFLGGIPDRNPDGSSTGAREAQAMFSFMGGLVDAATAEENQR